MIRIFHQKIKLPFNSSRPSFLSPRGFSLIEVLVALTILGVMIMAFDFDFTGGRDKLHEEIDNFSRAVAFAESEAILQSKIVRIHFFLDKEPQEYTIEYGPEGDFVIPSLSRFKDLNRLSLSEIEKYKEQEKKTSQRFEKVMEYNESNDVLNESVQILGIRTYAQKSNLTSGEPSLYFYPNGEKDAAIVFLATYNEMATLSLSPFSQTPPDLKFIPIPKNKTKDEIDALHFEEMEKAFTYWERH